VSFTESDLYQLVCWLSKFVVNGKKSSLLVISPEMQNKLRHLAAQETSDGAIKRAINFALTHERDGEID